MNVYWLEQAETDLPSDNEWLSASEIIRLESMRFEKRRLDWRLGRWTAKRALAVWLQIPAQPLVLAKIEIHPAPSGAPETFFAGKPADTSISLSHRAGKAMCALAPPGVDLGCDLEAIEPHSDAFVADYFTAKEQASLANVTTEDRDRRLAMLWSAKESTLKALRTGLRVDTRCVVVGRAPVSVAFNGWNPFEVHYMDDRIFRGWWQREDNILRTLVADPAPNPPNRLQLPAYFSDTRARCPQELMTA